ncbi:MAG: TRAM domain-containing protein [Armatimonadota bacterium]|nr:TRAM domain-containing protein [Armatimonadota bacterium]
MSARPFWILLAIAAIILVLWLVIKPIADMRITDDLLGMHQPGLGRAEINQMTFIQRWLQWYAFHQVRAIIITTALVLMGIFGGILIASVVFRNLVSFSKKFEHMDGIDKIALFLGLSIGLLLSIVFVPFISSRAGDAYWFLAIVVFVALMYISVWTTMSIKDELRHYFPGLARVSELGTKEYQKPKVLDTNVIIDGRIADICRTGFLEGTIYVPNFVLEELRHIADSEDFLRRARGRRGLDILNQMQKELNLVVKSFDTVDPTDAEEVDEKLVKVAKDIGGCIVTNDFNLNKVAELHGVTVLNVNELANALKPVVLPGEELTVSIIKEGKESNQGIAYLDDGTMIVVEGGKKHIGETIDVVVTSVLQTVAGKMIFANLKAVQEEEDELIERNIRNYSSIRPRKKIK